MSGHPVTGLLREALASIRAQPAFTLVTLLLVAASTMSVITTAGKAAASEAAVLAAIDAQGTRTVIIQAKGTQPGIDEQLVATLARVDDIEAVTGFGPVTDTTAAANPAGPRLGVRTAYGSIDGTVVTQPAPGPAGTLAWASRASTDLVGLPPAAGSLREIDGPELLITAALTVPPYLAGLEPLTVIPATPPAPNAPPRTLSTIYVLARTPAAVDVVTEVVHRLLAGVPADGATVETSAALADLRAAIGGELTQRSRGLILGVLAAATLASALTVLGYTLMRRKDFGRRRALGATRLTIVLLIAVQTLITAALAAALGATAATLWLTTRGNPHPPTTFTLAVAVAVTTLTTLAATLPATLAARRDPVRELRVP
ncbi:MAG: FtsX-like permease family protein [Tetrasphaera sp.]